MVLFHSEISFLEALHDATTQCPAKMVTPSTLPAWPHFAATMRGQKHGWSLGRFHMQGQDDLSDKQGDLMD